MGGCRFYVTFIDDHTRKVWVYFMKEKSEVFTHFQNFKVMAEKQTGKYVQCLRSDGGGEYFSNEFSSFLKKHGIQRQFTCRYTPQQNGVTERKNRHIAEAARALMSEKNVPHCYWAEAVSTAVYIMNRTPTAAVHNVTPEEKFTGKKPDLGHLKVFGCIAYVHVSDELRTKLDPKAEKCQYEEDIQSWVLQGEDLMYMLGIVDDEAMAAFMYQGFCKDAWQFDIGLPTYVQCSWSMMKHALLTYFVCSKPPARGLVYFCGTANECISSWIIQVEGAMTKLEIEDDAARAVYASQDLSHDAFVFLHMLPEDWRYSWLALRFSLLMHYQNWLVLEGSKDACFVKTFQSLQVYEFWDAL
ncbi:hypothetical protein L7F22_028776 [Adiantum nelumboides]|nr:hypothetical protein [Adiantum nelumboides]